MLKISAELEQLLLLGDKGLKEKVKQISFKYHKIVAKKWCAYTFLGAFIFCANCTSHIKQERFCTGIQSSC
jgi:hypothetical protein